MQARDGVRQFMREQGGSALVLFAICALVVFGAVGAAVDGSRWFAARQRHSAAVDAALLAGARYLAGNPGDTTGTLAMTQTYYANNLPASLDIASNTVTFVMADSNQAITFTGDAQINTTLMKLLGIAALPISSPAKASLAQAGAGQGSNLEIAMMLDVTGSMCDNGLGPCTSGTKIDGVKQAATNLATIILGQTSSAYTSRIALVPFSSAVRIDADGATPSLMQILTGMASTWSGYQNSQVCTGGSGYTVGELWVETSPPTCQPVVATYVSGWKLIPCVTERWFQSGAGFDASDSAPSTDNWLEGHGGDRFPLSWDSATTPMLTLNGTTAALGTWQWDYTPDGGGCMSQPGNEIVPLTSNLGTITNRINSLTAYGPTAGALGTAWVQYLLSPSWAGIWTGSSAPGSYADTQTRQASGAPLLRKVAVLMTDGGFNTFRQYAIDYSADNGVQMQTVSDYAVQVCTNMKRNGIEVYTVGFNLDALSPGEKAIATATLQACGTDLSHFYSSINTAQLQQAFGDIATRLTPVRLTQ